MTFKHFVAFLFAPILILSSCTQEDESKPNEASDKKELKIGANIFHSVNIAVEQDIVHDYFSPPVAGRIYLYPNLVAHQILAANHDSIESLNLLNGEIPEMEVTKFDSDLAACYAFLNVARELLYTVDHIDAEMLKLDSSYVDYAHLNDLKRYAEKCSDKMLEWLKEDRYNETRNMGEYQMIGTPGAWIPTPPDYMEALEPHWHKLRPITLDSASQFNPIPPTAYDMTKGSQYYNELMEVYEAVNSRNDTTEAIAKFWDCNPIIIRHEGHISYAEKKLTPGGHWVNICRMACVEQNFSFSETVSAYSSLCIGIYDAFISCWHTKYETNYIRPVTVIQNEIDPSWMPILVTPNFPEYTSGHSVVSRSAASVLTYVFGDNYSFTDSTEVPYGMPPRSFSSFFDASDEAAISRHYGGIHYKPAIYEGVKQGENVGNHIVSKLKMLANEQ